LAVGIISDLRPIRLWQDTCAAGTSHSSRKLKYGWIFRRLSAHSLCVVAWSVSPENCTIGSNEPHAHFLPPAIENMIEALREGIDLIVVAACGKRQQLLSEFVKPMCSFRKINRPGLDACGLRIHAHHLVIPRLDGNRMDIVALEILYQRRARSLVLNQ